ncbi:MULTISPECIES: hypothetical protein [unclassified Nocardioides]|uniref:hypothetical protein n=1 Tax=unclassified Nocardioides TaxID=2615069 RepID=UPI0006F76FB4|nr:MULTISPECIES: hypothetical protein [unclassified Nocardioides]KRA31360.1 hypothetical protein ASD81_18140 [Nocardioides sp. Root614]KRA87981.1 hypothetical protein ASD84_18415 [Nocardioides sp. Root682]
MPVRWVAAVAVVLVAATGCRATQWPSDADPAQFCEDMTGTQFWESGIDQLIIEHGTPEDLPFEARRYLIDLDEGRQTDPVGEQALEKYVADHC